MDKPGVYITSQQAEAISYLASAGWVNQDLLKFRLGVSIGEIYDPRLTTKLALSTIKEMNFDSLAIAIYDSYEVEKTPEEKLADYYKKLNLNEDSSADIAFGIMKTLQMLEIKVEGIN